MTPKKPLVLALHATSHGFGYVLFEGPFAPHDWGAVTARNNKSTTCLGKLEKLLDRFAPECLILEEFGRDLSQRRERLSRLYRSMASVAASRSIDVFVYTKAQIQACFVTVGARTRHEIADAIARQFEIFRHKLPKARKPWESEKRGMALFSAIALILTHYQLGASQLFNDLLHDAPS
jgi:Holliday junction resolvasome RuvABC endonuclease subunit